MSALTCKTNLKAAQPFEQEETIVKQTGPYRLTTGPPRPTAGAPTTALSKRQAAPNGGADRTTGVWPTGQLPE